MNSISVVNHFFNFGCGHWGTVFKTKHQSSGVSNEKHQLRTSWSKCSVVRCVFLCASCLLFCIVRNPENYPHAIHAFLHQTALAPNSFHAIIFLHKKRITPNNSCTKHFLCQILPDHFYTSYTKQLLQGTLTLSNCYSKQLLHQTVFTSETSTTLSPHNFYTRRQERKWIQVNGSDSKWKERKENEDKTKNNPQKLLNFIRYRFISHFGEGADATVLTTPLPMATLHYSNSTSLMHKWEDKWILFAVSRGDFPKSMLGYVGVLINYRTMGSSNHPKESSGRQPSNQASNRVKAKGWLSQF